MTRQSPKFGNLKIIPAAVGIPKFYILIFDFCIKAFKSGWSSEVAKKDGFTLLEMLVSIGIFSVLVVSSIAVIVSISAAQVKTSNIQNILDNARYTTELMSRELRQGKNYMPLGICSGDRCNTIKFTKFEDEPGGDGEVTVWYCHIINSATGNGEIHRWKQATGEGQGQCETASAEILTGAEVDIENLGFLIIGEETSGPNLCIQPRVTVMLSGKSNDLKTELESRFNLQTTVTQRIRKEVNPDDCD